MLAMHMANELLTPGVAMGFIALSAVLLLVASWRTRRQFDADRVPLMGVMGAFVFAAQMINFPVLPGTSGHLGGGVLLAILLGPHAATLVMASILIIQCLIFQDGGLLALGTNVLNMGVVPCYCGYVLFHLAAGPSPRAGRLYAAVFIATMVGMLAGAALVPVEVALSGVASVPLAKFLAVMVGLHVLVALGEGIITFLVIGYLSRVRPKLLGPVAHKLAAAGEGLSHRTVLVSVGVAALILGGVVSLFASGFPDALESIVSATTPAATGFVESSGSDTIQRVTAWQEHTAPLPDYRWTSASGLVGTAITLFTVWIVGRMLQRPRLKRFTNAPSPKEPRALARAAHRR